MTDVNPPPQIQMPPQIANDPTLRKYFQERDRFNLQIWFRTGGPEDKIEDAEQGLTSTGSRVSRNAAKINALEKTTFDIVITNSNYTTGPQEIVVCNNTSPIDVTLDPNPVEGDQVHIKRSDAAVNVIGAIDGITNRKINIKYFSLFLVFNGTDWSQI